MKKSLVLLLLFVFALTVLAQKNKSVSKNPTEKSKSEEVQLSDLPQTPKVQKETTDVQDEGLKGKVREIKEEIKYLSGNWKNKGRFFTQIIYFDNLGFLLREDYYGNSKFSDRTTYGYIEGKRVSKSITFIKNRPQVGGFEVEPNKEVLNSPDERYEYSYEYKYSDGKLTEMQMIFNTGKKGMRYIRKYSKNQVGKISYTENNIVNVLSLIKLDDKDNEIEEVETVNDTLFIKYSYAYEFDKQGNWIKQIKSKEVTENGKAYFQPLYETYRTITYY